MSFPPHIVAMAQELASYEDRRGHDLRDHFAILGDALEEFGALDLVEHCRDRIYHTGKYCVAKCKVLMAILGEYYWRNLPVIVPHPSTEEQMQ